MVDQGRDSAHNFRFGGIQDGWMGETSVPITSQFGNSSAKSLRPCLAASRSSCKGGVCTYMAQDPVPVAMSTTFCERRQHATSGRPLGESSAYTHLHVLFFEGSAVQLAIQHEGVGVVSAHRNSEQVSITVVDTSVLKSRELTEDPEHRSACRRWES